MKYLHNFFVVCVVILCMCIWFGVPAFAESDDQRNNVSNTTAVEPRALRSTATCMAILAAGDDDGDGVIDASNCDFRNQTIVFDGSNYNLSSSNLTNAVIDGSGSLNLSQTNLSSVNFINYLTGSWDINLKGSTILNAKFPNVEISNYSQPCNLTGVPSRLPSPNAVIKGGAIWGMPADYQGCNFSNTDLRGITVSNATLTGVNMSNANLSNTTWEWSNLTNANLNGANFTNADFIYYNDLRSFIGTPIMPNGYRKFGSGMLGAGLILSGWNLSNLDLRNVNLRGTYAIDVVISNTNFDSARMNNSVWNISGDCDGSSFRNVDLSRSSFVGDLGSCDISGVITADTCFIGVLPANYVFATRRTTLCPQTGNSYTGFFIGPGLRLSYRDLSGLSFAGADLSDVDFRGANLSYANFDGMTLTNVDLTDAIMVGTSLANADLRTASILGLRTGALMGNPLLPTGYAVRRQHIVGPQVNLFGARLQNLDLSNLDLSDSNLSGANLTGANLTNTDLSGANLVRANATNANLSRTELLRANLSRANLTGADLSQSNLEDTDMAGVTVTNARFANAVLSGVKSGRIVGTPASLPNDYAIRDGYFVGTQANLTNAELTDVNMNGINLSRATLNGLKSRNVTGTPLLPSRYRMVKGYVVGPNVNLMGADFTNQSLVNLHLVGADLRNAKLINANFAGANITNAMFRGADMTRIRSGRMVGTPASLPTGYIIRNGTFVKQ